MTRRSALPLLLTAAWLLVQGCAAPGPAPRPAVAPRPAPPAEIAPPDGPWRPHVLARCDGAAADRPGAGDRAVLTLAAELVRAGEGGDAIVELELHLRERPGAHSLVRLTLAELYILAGQGDPDLVPTDGPAADTGDWPRNRSRFLARARELLDRCGRERPDDAVVDYLIGDAVRAGGDLEGAWEWVRRAHGKCSLPPSLEMLGVYQHLPRSEPRQTAPVQPVYPPGAARDGASGEVVLDLLVAPAGRVDQVRVVSSPDRRLAAAAAEAFAEAPFAPARLGKYEVWAWRRVTVAFR